MIVCLNLCVCLDLVMMLRDPFRNVESRYLHYFCWSVAISLIPSTVRVSLSGKNIYVYGWIILGSFVLYVMIAAYSSIFA